MEFGIMAASKHLSSFNHVQYPLTLRQISEITIKNTNISLNKVKRILSIPGKNVLLNKFNKK